MDGGKKKGELQRRRHAAFAGGHWALLKKRSADYADLRGVLGVLWDRADFEHCTAEVSISALAELIGESNENRVRQALHHLEGLGLIRPRPDIPGLRGTKVYECLARKPLANSPAWRSQMGLDAADESDPWGDTACPPSEEVPGGQGGHRVSPHGGTPHVPRGDTACPPSGGTPRVPHITGGGGEYISTTTTPPPPFPPPRSLRRAAQPPRRRLTADEQVLVKRLIARQIWPDSAEDLVHGGLSGADADAVWKQVQREFNGDGVNAFNPQRQRNIRQPGSVYHRRLQNLLERNPHGPLPQSKT